MASARAILAVVFLAGPFPSTTPPATGGAAAAAFAHVAACLAVLTIFVRMAPAEAHFVAMMEKLLVSAATAAAVASVALLYL
nr:unnamed protein product [Digitaria exilis]